MSLPWVKLHTSVFHNRTFKRFTPDAKFTFVAALVIATEQDMGGRLGVPNLEPIAAREIAEYTGYPVRKQQVALDDLMAAGFLSKDLTGCYIVERFDEKAGVGSTRTSGAERQRRFRERHNNVTRNAEIVTDKDKEIDYASLRSAALDVTTWPQDATSLQSLARIFLARFGNCRDPQKQSRFVGSYAAVLATFRSRGITIETAWAACEECWAAGNEVPLFGGKFRDVLSYTTGRGAVPKPARENDRGDEMDRAIAKRTIRISGDA